MSESKHTPNGQVVCRVPEFDGEHAGIEARLCADARLIAAAPELLAACKALCENVDSGEFSIKCLDGEWTTANLDRMREAIAKAEGGK
jgi:hypothetical protein